jgi:glycosyltransferase involved in cell wall biosynthesis
VSRDDGILVLTTREKDWWLSLQEIIPAIDRVWEGVGRATGESVRTLCVPLPPEIEQDLEISASKVKRIVITSVTPGTVKVALLLRRQLKVTAPMTVYSHGDPTDGLQAFGDFADVLTEADTFVVACGAEMVAIRRVFPNAQVTVIPFPLVDQFKVSDVDRDAGTGLARLVYVGRVSEQKNLHTLLLALWLLRTSYDRRVDVTLDVYGGEDGLGSPNMGIQFADYGTYLRQLAESLGVADMVTWHGPKPRDWVFYNVHLEPHVFVSPTVHSDENFGSSVLASLVNGHQVVTTAWGGHFGFQKWFPRQLTLVPVHSSPLGPVVHPVQLADAIVAAVEAASTTVVTDAAVELGRAEFSVGGAVKRAVEMLGRPDGDPVPLKKSPVQERIDEHRALYGGKRRIYADYEDPLAQIFFEAYGMADPLAFEEQASYVLPPWVSCSDQELQIIDPHRGNRTLAVDATASEQVEVVMCPSTNTRSLPAALVEALVAQGYAFSLPPARAAIDG